LVLFGFVLGGCESGGEDWQRYATEVEQVVERMDAYHGQIDALAAEVALDGLVDANDLARLAMWQARVDELQTRLVTVARAVGGTDYSSEGVLATLEALQAANAAVGTYPYSGVVSAILAALVPVLGLWGGRERAARGTAEAAASAETTILTDVVRSIKTARAGDTVDLKMVRQDRATESRVREIEAS
jgi:hypothetical protein